MFGSPDHTPYDLHFRAIGIPVRVHPLFWLIMVMISGSWRLGGSNELLGAVVFCACAFLSVLVHEMGHGLSARAFGDEPSGIVLYAFGGYCQVRLDWQAPWQRLIVLLMGPGAGFLLLAVVLLAIFVAFGIQPLDFLALIGIGPGDPFQAIVRLPRVLSLRYALLSLVEINLMWGLLNLLPLWPLDGGRITEVLLGYVNRRAASRWAHVVSLLTAALLAMWMASRQDWWLAIWFGVFAVVNYQMLQVHYDAHRAGWWET